MSEREQTIEELRAENTNLREFIAASEEVAVAKDVMWYADENERIRASFNRCVEELKNGGTFKLSLSGCEWCGLLWPKPDDSTIEETKERARRHVFACSGHPLRIERDALSARLATAEAALVEARRERDELAGNAALMSFTRLMGMDPVRPDLHAKVLRQRDEAMADLRAVRDRKQEWLNWSDEIAPPFGSARDRSDAGQRAAISEIITTARQAAKAAEEKLQAEFAVGAEYQRLWAVETTRAKAAEERLVDALSRIPLDQLTDEERDQIYQCAMTAATKENP